jgi:exopolysaccharide biosynthesis polyprenyl glycosylphosphotransferase
MATGSLQLDAAALRDAAQAAQPVPSVVANRYLPRDATTRRMLALADLGGFTLGLLAMALVAPGSGALVEAVLAPAWIVLFKAYGLYDQDIRRISHWTVDDLPHLGHAVLVGSLLVFLVGHALPGVELHFAAIAAFAAVSAVASLVLRGIMRRVIRRLLGPERALLIGPDALMTVLARKIAAHPEYALVPVGVLSRPDGDMERLVAERRVERLVIANAGIGSEQMLGLMQRASQLLLKVSLVPEVFGAIGSAVQVDDVEGLTVLGINPPVLSRSSRALKRSLDVGVAALTLLVCLPLLAIIAVAIRLESPGPALFRQPRVGSRGRRFTTIKFRTMVRDAERLTVELAAQSQDPNWLLLEHDPRITRVGRLLRLTSLDELPQLFNVLRGDMSLVGPRPLQEADARQIIGWASHRLDLTPGLTGLWQVLGRTSIPFEEMIKLDYLYVTNWSLWGDVRLLLKTVPVVVSRRGAN